MGWLCMLCETININPTFNSFQDTEICKCCKIDKKKYQNLFDFCLTMNERIDNFFPRHQFEWDFSCPILDKIGYPKLNSELSYEYVINRLKYRNAQATKKWKRKVSNRKFVNIILDKINIQRSEQFNKRLILQFLF